jgi:hypothetical protein
MQPVDCGYYDCRGQTRTETHEETAKFDAVCRQKVLQKTFTVFETFLKTRRT